ncbi:MAG TPA: DivIVA domain-containing protein [Kribbella sp.]|nr:DivIVA domain-containing protein [Kribbella sp.]
MTPEDAFARRPAQSPRAIRTHSFTTRRRGLDPEEVAAYLGQLAEQVEQGDADRADLRAQLEQFRNRTPDSDERAHITAHAVGLLSQAQQIADNLVAEAEQYAKDLVEAARHQHRDVLKQAHDSVESAVKHLPPGDAAAMNGTQVPTAELEYVRTFTQVAHIQLRSVLDALAEQVERLGHLPEVPGGPPSGRAAVASVNGLPGAEPDPGGDVQWWTDLSAQPDRAHERPSPGFP